jgi:dTMP kinase
VLIAFEGGEGTGKSTQVAALAAALRADGFRVRCTFEPGGTPAGQQIRQIVLGSSHALDARAEALLFAADRANHVATVIGPALRAGEVVLTDRFLDSSLAYQGAGRSLSVDEVRDLSRWAIGTLTPDLTIVLDLPVAEGLRRAGKRGSTDRLESETLHFHERVRQAFLAYAAAEPDRYAVVDATGSRTSVAAAVRAAVGAVLSRRPASPAREPTAVAPGGGAQRTGDPGEVAT